MRFAKPKSSPQASPTPLFHSNLRIRPTQIFTAGLRPTRFGRTPTAKSIFLSAAWARAGPSPGYPRQLNPANRVFRPSPSSRPVQRCSRASQPGPTQIQGVGAGFVPAILNTGIIDEIITVRDEDALVTARRLAKHEGIPAGISSGATVWATLQVAARPENAGKMLVVILASSAERYLSTALVEDL